MGNTQDKGGFPKRDRADSTSAGGGRHSRAYTQDDECPVQVKIAKSSTIPGQIPPASDSTPSMQYENTIDFPVVIKWKGGGTAKNVAISGDWDSWKKKIPLVKSQEDFTTILNLPEGKHEFKFCVDGNWICDTVLPKTDNPVGSQNNVIAVDRADFEVFDALDKDQAQTGERENKPAHIAGAVSKDSSSGGGSSETIKSSFCQDIPDRHEFERAHHPPILPPHLLQVILNKDTPVSCDPNVLPEPNHVMLNHLYALSIKDGVMVLSATHRYRKKYVTTLLYKPI